MKPLSQLLVVVALSVGFSLPSRGDEPLLPQAALHLLTAIDMTPSRAQLESALPGNTATRLLEIASSDAVDLGVRLSAIRALSIFPSTEARAALKQLLTLHQAAQQGASVLLTLATLESLGQFGMDEDVPLVAALLTHPSRDVRVTVARTLGQIGAASAIDALRERQSSENVLAVKLAISEAIQALGQTL